MMDGRLTVSFISSCLALAFAPCLRAQSATGEDKPSSTVCMIERPGVRLRCPQAWYFLVRDDTPYSSESVISNFEPSQDNRRKRSGPGMATIGVQSIPRDYKDLSYWIWVAHTKMAPEAIETKFSIVGEKAGKVDVVCLTSPEQTGLAYSSYFFQIGKTPILIEVNYRAQDLKKSEYIAAAKWMIERAEAIR
jgi:hypothetical protein